MSEFEDEIKAALQYAGAHVLLALQAAERGYLSLVAHEPIVADGVAVAHAQAATLGVPADQVAITPTHVLLTAREMGAAGVNPADIAVVDTATGAPIPAAALAPDAPKDEDAAKP